MARARGEKTKTPALKVRTHVGVCRASTDHPQEANSAMRRSAACCVHGIEVTLHPASATLHEHSIVLVRAAG